MTSTSAKATIPRLDKIFAVHGVPRIVKSDNGPPFQSAEFRQFSEYLGFTHRRITPMWPRANGEVERFMRTINKAVCAAQIESIPWKQQLWCFLRFLSQHTPFKYRHSPI